MERRKSAVDLTDLAIGVLVLGITVTIGSRIMLLYRNNRLTGIDQSTIANETATSVTETGEVLTSVWVNSVDSCYNGTGVGSGPILQAGNYTASVNELNGLATVSYSSTGVNDSLNYNNTDWTCSYTVYNTTSPEWSLPNDTALGLAEFGNWFDIIVIVGVAGLILTLLFLAFGRRGEETGVVY